MEASCREDHWQRWERGWNWDNQAWRRMDGDDGKEAIGNSKALNSLFNKVDKNVFKLINMCTVAKEAWEIL